MTDSNNPEPAEVPQKPDRICAWKGCNVRIGLKKTKTKNWMCTSHHPASRKKSKLWKAKGGRKAGRMKRARADVELSTLTLNIEPNKASILTAMVQQANFLGKNLQEHELRKHALVVELMNRIHEYATLEGDDANNAAKISEIMESTLPQEIKLSKLVDIVGANKAIDMIKVEVIREGYPSETLDGEQLLRDNGESGDSTIGKPDNFELKISDDTEDLPPVDPDAPALLDLSPAGDLAAPAAPTPPTPAAVAAAGFPADAAPPAPPPGHDKISVCSRQSTELMGLYRQKVRGNFMDLDKVAKIFNDALLEGVPFEDLRQRVFFPKGDTDQPTLMVKDVKATIAKKKGAG